MRQNKITKLTNFLRFKGIFASHVFVKFAAREGYNDPARLKRKLAERAVIKELTTAQLRAIGKQNSVEKWWYYSGNFPILQNKHKYKMIGIEI